MGYQDQKTWAENYGVSVEQVQRLRQFIDQRVEEAAHAIKGDTHPGLESGNEFDHARAWWEECMETDALILAYARSMGFDCVDFSVSFYPVLTKGSETCFMVPSS